MKTFLIFLKLYDLSWLAIIITIFWQHFRIDKTWKLIIRKNYKPILYQEIEAFNKDYNVYLAFKAIWYMLYKNL